MIILRTYVTGTKTSIGALETFAFIINVGQCVGFSKEVCYSTIYACISLSIFMSSKFMWDKCGQNFLPGWNALEILSPLSVGRAVRSRSLMSAHA